MAATRLATAAAIITLGAASAAWAQTSVWTDGSPGRPLPGGVITTATYVAVGEVIDTTLFEFRHAGRLIAPIADGADETGANLIAAGTPGHTPGTIYPAPGAARAPLWCFPLPTSQAAAGPACLVAQPAGGATLVETDNPWFPTRYRVTDHLVSAPEIDQGPLNAPPIASEYRFAGWKDGAAIVEEWTEGARVRERHLPKLADNSAILLTSEGALRLTPAEDDQHAGLSLIGPVVSPSSLDVLPPPTRPGIPVQSAPPRSGPWLFSQYFPKKALRHDVSGHSIVQCQAVAGGLLKDCRILSETPADYEFGDATLKIMARVKLRLLTDLQGAPLEGRTIVIPFNFAMED